MLEGETSWNHLPNVYDIALSLVGGEDSVGNMVKMKEIYQFEKNECCIYERLFENLSNQWKVELHPPSQ